jgi:hypothetical protein
MPRCYDLLGSRSHEEHSLPIHPSDAVNEPIMVRDSTGAPAVWSGIGRRGNMRRLTAKSKGRLAVLAGVLSLGLVTGLVAQAAVTRSGPIRAFDGVDEIVFECTNTTNYNSIPEMRRTFTVGGNISQPVIAMFEGSLSLDKSGGNLDTGFLRLTIDGVEQSPGEIPAIEAGGRGTHGFNWQTTPLAPGSHIARVQWRTDLGGNYCADARSLIVIHR